MFPTRRNPILHLFVPIALLVTVSCKPGTVGIDTEFDISAQGEQTTVGVSHSEGVTQISGSGARIDADGLIDCRGARICVNTQWGSACFPLGKKLSNLLCPALSHETEATDEDDQPLPQLTPQVAPPE